MSKSTATAASKAKAAAEAPAEVTAVALVQARALVDLPQHNVLAGHALEGPATTVQALVASGQADATPAAVEYALSVGSALTRIE
jgi:hypothetical protein